MQFRLRSLFILTAAVAVFCGIITAPWFLAIPLLCALSCLWPAYWIAGVIYARDSRRAFFIGGIAAGALPYIVLAVFIIAAAFDEFDMFRFTRRRGYTENLLTNLFAAGIVLTPTVLAFLGGWIALAVYRSLQPPKPVVAESPQSRL